MIQVGHDQDRVPYIHFYICDVRDLLSAPGKRWPTPPLEGRKSVAESSIKGDKDWLVVWNVSYFSIY